MTFFFVGLLGVLFVFLIKNGFLLVVLVSSGYCAVQSNLSPAHHGTDLQGKSSPGHGRGCRAHG